MLKHVYIRLYEACGHNKLCPYKRCPLSGENATYGVLPCDRRQNARPKTAFRTTKGRISDCTAQRAVNQHDSADGAKTMKKHGSGIRTDGKKTWVRHKKREFAIKNNGKKRAGALRGRPLRGKNRYARAGPSGAKARPACMINYNIWAKLPSCCQSACSSLR